MHILNCLFLHLDAFYAYMIYMHILSWTLGTESTRRAARQAMMKPQHESSFGCLLAKLLRRRLDGGLVAERTLKSNPGQAACPCTNELY